MTFVIDTTERVAPTNTEGFVITATVVDDLPYVTPGFEAVASAADLAMWEVLADDLDMELVS